MQVCGRVGVFMCAGVWVLSEQMCVGVGVSVQVWMPAQVYGCVCIYMYSVWGASNHIYNYIAL